MSKLAKRRRKRGILGMLTAIVLTGCPGGFNPAAAPPISAADERTRDELQGCVRLFAQKGRVADAKRCFEAAAAKTQGQGSELVVELYLGRLALRAGDDKGAYERFAKLTKRDLKEPLRSSSRYFAGLAAARLGKARIAIEHLDPLEKSVDAQSRPALLAAMASAEVRLGQVERAMGHLARLHATSDRPTERAYARTTLERLLDDTTRRPRWPAIFAAAKSGSLLRALLGRRLSSAALARGELDRARSIEQKCAAALQAHGITSLLSGPPASDGTRVLVVWVPLSGPYAKVGKLALAGVAFASGSFATAPAAGGPPLVVFDSAAPDAISRLTRLIRSPGVVALVGGFSASRTRALARLARSRNIPLVDLVNRPEGSSTARYHALPSAAARAHVLARAAIGRHPRARAVILAPETPYGRRMGQTFAKALTDAGGKVLQTTTYPAKATSFSSHARAIAKLSPDVVFVPDRGTKLALIAPALGAAGLWASTPRQPGGKSISLVATADGLSAAQAQRWSTALSGAIIAPGFFPLASQALVAAYRRFAGRLPSLVEAYAHDAALSLLAPLRAGLGAQQALQRALSTRTVSGLTGKLRFEATGKRADSPPLYRFGASGLSAYTVGGP